MSARPVVFVSVVLALLLLVAVAPLGAFAGPVVDLGTEGWVQQGPDDSHLLGVSFPDATHGCAVGESGLIVATSDGGATWAPQVSGTQQILRAVCFPDATHGWAVGDGGTILRATLGGWVAQQSGTGAWLYGVSFSDAGNGVAVGGSGTILATGDGGVTWTVQATPTGSTLWGVSCPDAAHAWAVGEAGTIVRAAAGGWSKQDSGTTVWLHDVDFVDASHGWAVGEDGVILATTDGGAHWSSQTSGTTRSLWSVDFVDASHGWAVGFLGIILATSDGGVHWAVQGSDATLGLESVSFADVTHGWAVGTSTILATTTGGWPVLDLHVTAPVAGASWPSGSTRTVSWTVSPAVQAGEFRVWLVSSTGGWYVNRQVLPVAGQTSYSVSLPVSCPPGSYTAYVYWRPVIGVGDYPAKSKSAGFTVTPLNIASPTAASSWPSGSTQTVSWTINPTVAAGEFKVWLVSGASWYVGKVVPAAVGQSSYGTSVAVSCPAGTYRPYVYYRPTAGAGDWTIKAVGAVFSVTPVNITTPTAHSQWKTGSSQAIAWTVNPKVAVGEFKVWLVRGLAWYVGTVVPAVGAQSAYTAPVTVSCPAGTYRAYVYYRPTVGSGSWTVQTIGAAFAVTP